MKIIKISNCTECKYYSKSQMSVGIVYCAHEDNVATGSYPIIPDFPNIPDWCALEDEQDLTPSLDILQGHLKSGNHISYNSGRIWGCESIVLFRRDGEEIASSKTLKELLIDLIKKE